MLNIFLFSYVLKTEIGYNIILYRYISGKQSFAVGWKYFHFTDRPVLGEFRTTKFYLHAAGMSVNEIKIKSTLFFCTFPDLSANILRQIKFYKVTLTKFSIQNVLFLG